MNACLGLAQTPRSRGGGRTVELPRGSQPCDWGSARGTWSRGRVSSGWLGPQSQAAAVGHGKWFLSTQFLLEVFHNPGCSREN